MTADHQLWQKGRDAKYDVETFDEVLVENSKRFMDQAKQADKPFFIWHNATRMHVFTYLQQKCQAKMDPQSNYGLEEGGVAELDDNIGDLLAVLPGMAGRCNRQREKSVGCRGKPRPSG